MVPTIGQSPTPKVGCKLIEHLPVVIIFFPRGKRAISGLTVKNPHMESLNVLFALRGIGAEPFRCLLEFAFGHLSLG